MTHAEQTPVFWQRRYDSEKDQRDRWARFAVYDCDGSHHADWFHSIKKTVQAAERMSVCEQYDGHGDGSHD